MHLYLLAHCLAHNTYEILVIIINKIKKRCFSYKDNHVHVYITFCGSVLLTYATVQLYAREI